MPSSPKVTVRTPAPTGFAGTFCVAWRPASAIARAASSASRMSMTVKLS